MAEVFQGKASEMRQDSPWLSFEDVRDIGEIELEIEAVYVHKNVKFEMGRSEPVVYSLKFKGARKQLIVNAGTRRMLGDRFGGDVVKWSGKKVTVYPDPTVKRKGKIVGGVRLK